MATTVLKTVKAGDKVRVSLGGSWFEAEVVEIRNSWQTPHAFIRNLAVQSAEDRAKAKQAGWYEDTMLVPVNSLVESKGDEPEPGAV